MLDVGRWHGALLVLWWMRRGCSTVSKFSCVRRASGRVGWPPISSTIRQLGRGGVLHHMGGTNYGGGAPKEHEDEKIRVKRSALNVQAAAHFRGVEGNRDQALKNAKLLSQLHVAKKSTELYTLGCASGKAAIFVFDTGIHLVFLAKSRAFVEQELWEEDMQMEGLYAECDDEAACESGLQL